jgi:hypothetical protein
MTLIAQVFMKITIAEGGFVSAFNAEFCTNQTKNAKKYR